MTTTPTATDEHHVTITHSAAQELARIGEQVQAVMDVWHKIDPERANRCAVTGARQTGQLLTSFFGVDLRISRDDDLMLFVSAGNGFCFGMVGHRQVRPDSPKPEDPRHGSAPVMGRFCFTAVGDTYCGKSIEKDQPTCEGHPVVVMAAPVPVEWSFHS